MTALRAAFREVDARMTRPTGAVFGALRVFRLAAAAARGLVVVQVAHARGGEAAARDAFSGVAYELADVLGVSIDTSGVLDPSAHEIRVANHTSYLDVLVVAAARGGRFLSRHDVEGWPLVGRVASQVGTLFVDRASHGGRAKALRALGRAAGEGAPLVIFPEGKTSAHALYPFARGAFTVARAAGVAVQPLAIAYDDVDEVAWVDDMTFLPHLFRRLSGPYVRAEVHALSPIPPSDRKAGEVATEAREAIARFLGRGLR